MNKKQNEKKGTKYLKRKILMTNQLQKWLEKEEIDNPDPIIKEKADLKKELLKLSTEELATIVLSVYASELRRLDNIIEEMKDNIALRRQLACFKYKQERDNVRKTFSELQEAKSILIGLSDMVKRLENRKVWVEAINLLLYKEILAENPWIMEEE